jgi:hypothetical protein
MEYDDNDDDVDDESEWEVESVFVERNQIKYFVLKLDHFKCILSEPHELYA